MYFIVSWWVIWLIVCICITLKYTVIQSDSSKCKHSLTFGTSMIVKRENVFSTDHWLMVAVIWHVVEPLLLRYASCLCSYYLIMLWESQHARSNDLVYLKGWEVHFTRASPYQLTWYFMLSLVHVVGWIEFPIVCCTTIRQIQSLSPKAVLSFAPNATWISQRRATKPHS